MKVEQITADKLIICQQRNHVVVPGEISGIDKIISNANAHPAKILTDGKFFGTGVVEENDRTGRKSSIEMTSSQNIGTIANNMLKETECLHHNKIKSSIFEKMFSNVIICITKDQEAITH